MFMTVSGEDLQAAVRGPNFIAACHVLFVTDAYSIPGFSIPRETRRLLESPTVIKDLMTGYKPDVTVRRHDETFTVINLL